VCVDSVLVSFLHRGEIRTPGMRSSCPEIRPLRSVQEQIQRYELLYYVQGLHRKLTSVCNLKLLYYSRLIMGNESAENYS